MDDTPDSFRTAYEILQRHADALRRQEEPNIDELLDIVNESVQAYKICKARIEAVEKALEKALEDPDLPDTPGTSAAAQHGAPQEGAPQDGAAADDDDDVPF
ncbi:exodeoxyribonuclease VII small subunit [Castellaniella sp.]|uniref:exodeoxyribonuclease VII small subunit n=1 Tax=Castellaniella sp. TaxID=1955812 RepID=UPI00355E57CB